MSTTTVQPLAHSMSGSQRLSELEHLIEQLAQYLPAQGPITSFAMLNPLEGLESEPFEQGAERGGLLNACDIYLPEDRYRQFLESGRIRESHLEDLIREELQSRCDERVCLETTRKELRLTLLLQRFPTGDSDELSWVMAESGALDHLQSRLSEVERHRWRALVKNWVLHAALAGRTPLPGLMEVLAEYDLSAVEAWTDDVWEAVGLRLLWTVCQYGVRCAVLPTSRRPDIVRLRDPLLARTGRDSDDLVIETLGPYCAAFADQGLAHWPLPGRDRGFLAGFAGLYAEASVTPWGRRSIVAHTLQRVRRGELTAIELIAESLADLGIEAADEETFLTASLLAFRGWAGMLRQMEVRGDRFPMSAPAGTLCEYFAVQLLLERWALQQVAADEPGDATSLRDRCNVSRAGRMGPVRRPEQWTYKLYQLAQTLGWDLAGLARLHGRDWTRIIEELADFGSDDRRRVFHAAYERQYLQQALDAFRARSRRPLAEVAQPLFQAMFCIDAREESFRRHLEELEPRVETFGNAGFFNVPIYYRGAADACYAALCPIVVRPQHWVTEEVALTLEEEHRRRAQIRRVLGNVSMGLHRGSRGLTAGAFLSAGLGVLASVPLVTRILFPRLSLKLRRTVDRFVAPPPVTRLRLERTTEKPGPEGSSIGLTVSEMSAMAERALRDTGLTKTFAPLIFIFGHGSACLNNPHKSAYDCGACTGNAGGPNARALAMMLNDPRVRRDLLARGISIPADSVFIGGLHNTGDDTLTYYDLDLLPLSAVTRFQEARAILEQACQRNSHERCRRFYSAPLTITPAAAHRLVEERTEDLAQTRPEYGNCTNAVCFVGRRSRIRGLFLDRRAFLMSYDHRQDDSQGTILGRILGAVVPVCSGINLQYTFSAIDPGGWGAGTKLPHNVTSLVGVMDGAASDLRSGLPWQGVDIHEPMRLLFVMETTPERLQQVMARSPIVDRILRNRWAHLAVVDPETGRVREYRPNGVHDGDLDELYRDWPEPDADLPHVDSSLAWYRGQRGHLGFAIVGAPTSAPLTPHGDN